MKSSMIDLDCLVYALFISITVYIFAFSRGNFSLLLGAQAVFCLWVMYKVVWGFARIRMSSYNATMWWLLGLALIISVWVNSANYGKTSVEITFVAARLVALLIYTFAAQWAANNLSPEKILEYLAFLLTPLIAYACLISWGASQRAMPLNVHPNWWGEVAFGFSLCSMSVTHRLLRVTFIIGSILLMYFVQSRGAMIASVCAITVFWLLNYRPFGKTQLRLMLVSVFMLNILVAYLFAMDHLSALIAFIEDRVLLLNDPYRGIGTGLAGRVYGWREALDIFLESPFFGNGFSTLGGVHNGFIQLAAEGGIILFGIIIFMIFWSFRIAWQSNNTLVLAIIIGTIVYLMTYPRSLNLNIAGTVFLISLFPWEHPKECRQQCS